MELRLSLDELSSGPAQQQLLSTIGQAMRVGSHHACLGCQPCNPSDILADFYREQQAQSTAPHSACADAG